MNFKYLIIAAAAAVSLSACQNDDSTLEDLGGSTKEEPMDISFPTSFLPESPDVVPDPSAPDYNDYVESFNPGVEINITFTQSGEAVVDNPSKSITVTTAGNHVTANIRTKAVRFVLSGESADGSLSVEGENRFSVVLNGLTLTNPSGAVIDNRSKKTLYIECPASTLNILTSGAAPTVADGPKGCIFSEGQIAFSGSGLLTVNSAFRNGIASDDYIFVRPSCRLAVNATAGNGLKANDGVTIAGGNINIAVSYDGAKGINSESFINVAGGRTTIINDGTTRLAQVEVSELFPSGIDTINCAGMKCDGDLTISAGEVNIKCTGASAKGINCAQAYTQSGGIVNIVTLGRKELSSPKALKADLSITITAGTLYAYSRYSTPIDSDGPISVYAYRRQLSYLVEVGN